MKKNSTSFGEAILCVESFKRAIDAAGLRKAVVDQILADKNNQQIAELFGLMGHYSEGVGIRPTLLDNAYESFGDYGSWFKLGPDDWTERALQINYQSGEAQERNSAHALLVKESTALWGAVTTIVAGDDHDAAIDLVCDFGVVMHDMHIRKPSILKNATNFITKTPALNKAASAYTKLIFSEDMDKNQYYGDHKSRKEIERRFAQTSLEVALARYEAHKDIQKPPVPVAATVPVYER